MKRTDPHHSTANIRGKVSRSAFEYQLRLWLLAFSRGLFWGSFVMVLTRFFAVWTVSPTFRRFVIGLVPYRSRPVHLDGLTTRAYDDPELANSAVGSIR